MSDADRSAFEQARAEHSGAGRRLGIAGEFLGFIRHSKKWWLLPILAIFLALGAFVALGGSAVAPFIYALF